MTNPRTNTTEATTAPSTSLSSSSTPEPKRDDSTFKNVRSPSNPPDPEESAGSKQQREETVVEQEPPSKQTQPNTTIPSLSLHEELRASLLNLTLVPGAQKLEVVHIPKTGGSALEIAAARANVSWGLCHHRERFGGGMPNRLGNFPKCPKEEYEERKYATKYMCYAWHVLPCFYKRRGFRSYYFKDNVAVFAVVRNPYHRAISEYNYRFRKRPNNQTADGMNDYLLGFLRNLKKSQKWRKDNQCDTNQMNKFYFQKDCHYVPQVDYIYGIGGSKEEQIVHHVILFEHMGEDFRRLIDLYGMNITLPSRASTLSHDKGYNKAARNQTISRPPKLKVEDLWPETRNLIEIIYRDDFEAFGYEYFNSSTAAARER